VTLFLPFYVIISRFVCYVNNRNYRAARPARTLRAPHQAFRRAV